MLAAETMLSPGRGEAANDRQVVVKRILVPSPLASSSPRPVLNLSRLIPRRVEAWSLRPEGHASKPSCQTVSRKRRPANLYPPGTSRRLHFNRYTGRQRFRKHEKASCLHCLLRNAAVTGLAGKLMSHAGSLGGRPRTREQAAPQKTQ